eukprot:scaffold305623_cov17-Tisochrysis_lutea.AAC.1
MLPTRSSRTFRSSKLSDLLPLPSPFSFHILFACTPLGAGHCRQKLHAHYPITEKPAAPASYLGHIQVRWWMGPAA